MDNSFLKKPTLFNSSSEFAIRTLLVLAEVELPMTLERIFAYDFIATYPTEFGVGVVDINGRNCFKFSEFALRRESIKKAVKLLLFKELIGISNNYEAGFNYLITSKGNVLAEKLNSEYSRQYRINVARTEEKFCMAGDLKLMSMINFRAVNVLGE